MRPEYQKQWEFLKKKFEAGQMAHAYLLSGREGTGKEFFAKNFAEFIGCKFPDFMLVEKKQDKAEIEILQAREAQKFLSYKPYNSSYKVLTVKGAEKMSKEAQNCFLKTLEEPKGKTLLFLTTQSPDMLLGTIVSRCQTIKFFMPTGFQQGEVKNEKEIFKNISSLVNSSFSEKFNYAKSLDFEKQSPMDIVMVIQKYFRKQLLDDFSSKKAKKVLELTEEISNKLNFTNANPRLAMEILLMEI